LGVKAGWTVKPLAAVCRIKPPKAEARRQISANDLVSFVPMESLGIDQKILVPTQTRPLSEVAGSYTYFADGDVLLAKITPCFENGKLGIAANLVNGIGFGSSEYIVFRPDASVDKEWLYYFLARESFRNEGAERMTGAVGHKRVAKDFIESYPIPVPPLPEQQRIITLLDEAFDGIATARANAEKNLQNARALFQSHLLSVFTQRGEGWTQRPLGELCELISGQHIDAADYNTESRGVGYLTGPSDFGERYPVVTKWTEFPKRMACAGDILITVKGSGVGKINLMNLPELAISRQLMAIRATTAAIEYLHAFLTTNFGYFQSLATGAAIPGISRGDVLQLLCPMPPPEQMPKIMNRIRCIAEQTQRLESIYQQKLATLDELKKSLLHQAFSGNL
jgi:type I restriction enzyme, S subunit